MKKQNLLLVVTLLVFLAACNSNSNSNTSSNSSDNNAKKDSMKPTISETPFGNFEGNAITQYTITNASGMQVKILNYGGTVTGIFAPDRNGNKANVLLSYDSLSGYTQKNNPYFGALIGRYGNRIGNAKFTLDGKTYTLAANDHGNTLHGGLKGFDKVVWKAEKPAGDSSLQLTYTSKDGEEGFPGNLSVKVIYTLTADNGLMIDYTATTDKATPLNLTNHSYFNLSGGKDSTILAEKLMINADRFTEVNENLIPTGKLPAVKGTPMDFTSPKMIGKDIDQVKGGYDHNWVLNRTGNDLEKAATVEDSTSGRYMEVWTTQPGLQFYTGNFLDGSLLNTSNGARYVKHSALCLETQHFPDSPNQPQFPTTILKPGETYHQQTVYKFSTKQ